MPNNDVSQLSKPWIIYALFLGVFWLLLTHQGVFTAIEIWTISEVFNHCYIVIPASIYLIWEKRRQVSWHTMTPTMWPLPILLGQVLLYLFGSAGDIQVFMHIAAFTMLPTLIWIAVGNNVAKQLMFPLAFMVFAIPIGEELVPTLQEITADYSVVLLEMSGIPLYRSGLYIEIPQGKFLVAEACSGISFLIASIVLGNLYAYMNLQSWKARIFFVALSIIFPIFANVVRVYGIIMIGYWSDMEHAVGADHLIYGWFFFAFVLVCLFLIGEFIRKKERQALTKSSINSDSNQEPSKTSEITNSSGINTLHLIPLALIVLATYKVFDLANTTITTEPTTTALNVSFDPYRGRIANTTWQPLFNDSITQYNYAGQYLATPFSVFSAVYLPNQGELISSLNRLYIQDRWSLADFSLEYLTDNTAVNKHYISSARGDYMRVYYVYIIGDRIIHKKIHAKLYETWLKLSSNGAASTIVAVAFEGKNNAALSGHEQHVLTQVISQINQQVAERF